MKILILNTFYYPNIVGGAEKSTQLLVEGLKKRGIDVVVVSFGKNNSINYVNDIKVYYINSGLILKLWNKSLTSELKIKILIQKLIDTYNPTVRKVLKDIINKEDPDIVHTNNLYGFSPYAWEVFKEENLPVVHTIRDHYLLCIRGVMFKNEKNCEKQCLSCKLFSIYKKNQSNLVDSVVGVSKYILKRHLNYGFFENAIIKTNIYNPAPKITLNYRTRNENKIIFGYVGQISKGKGIELLLKNFIKLSQENIELHIYGKGTVSYENYLKNKYKNKNIKFMGFKKEGNIYENIDVTIIPSLLNEAFPRIPLESYSHGIPVISSKRGGTSEAIINSKTGFIFEPNKENDLKEKMKIFIENPKLINEFSKNCLKFVENFDEDKIVNQYIDVYKALIEKKERDYEL